MKTDAILDSVKTTASENHGEIKNLQKDKVENDRFDEFVNEVRTNFRTIRGELENVGNRIKATDEFIDKHLPIKTFFHISDALHACLEDSNRKKYVGFEERT